MRPSRFAALPRQSCARNISAIRPPISTCMRVDTTYSIDRLDAVQASCPCQSIATSRALDWRWSANNFCNLKSLPPTSGEGDEAIEDFLRRIGAWHSAAWDHHAVRIRGLSAELPGRTHKAGRVPYLRQRASAA